ncbi:MAG: hypothetical protein ACOVJ8_04480 [Sediminibacterium sp.]
MVFLVALLGAFIGRLFIGGVLNFIFKPDEHNSPNPENMLGWVGAILGVIISVLIYNS